MFASRPLAIVVGDGLEVPAAILAEARHQPTALLCSAVLMLRYLRQGDDAEELCRVACTGCGKCALDAATGLIEISDGLAVIDYTKNDQAGPEALVRCPTGAIAWVEGSQFADRRREPAELASE